MKIAMMTPWNTSCGVAMHAELVGREWVKRGHELKVLAPVEKEIQPVTGADELYVTRCYTMDREFIKGILKPLTLDPKPFLELDYDVFIVQNLELMPMPPLLKLWPRIKEKAATILVIHEGYLPPYPEFYAFDWDAIVCFDQRYVDLFGRKFPKQKINVIPYPYHSWQPGQKEAARIALGLPPDKKIVLSYGIAIHQHFVALPALEELSRTYDLMYLVLPAEGKSDIVARAQARYGFMEVRGVAPTVDELYTYLHAADALLLYKQSPNIVVCSTVYLCAGSGCPIVVSEGRYTEALGDEVLKYRDFDELKEVLSDIFNGHVANDKSVRAFVRDHEAARVAQQFIDLATSLRLPRTPILMQEPVA